MGGIMDQFSFVFTIFFMLLGPLKIIPAFAGVTRGADDQFSRALAIRAAVIASIVVAVVALTGERLLSQYRISFEGLRIAAGLVLLLAALNTIFSKTQPPPAKSDNVSVLQLAVSPMATPVIVPPAGVAAILTFMMLAPEYPGMLHAVAIALTIIMLLDFLVMYFHKTIMKLPGLILVLQLAGAVLVFMQAALAVQVMLTALLHLGIIPGPGP
jgi:multiple antibiotic resistance protein